MKRKLNILFILLLIGIAASAQYTYQRKLSEVTQTGWYRFTLPPALMTKIKPGFDDLRIYATGNDSTEIPYLVRIAADEIIREQVKAEPFNISRQGTTLYFSVKLNRVEPVNLTTLQFEQDNYDAEVTIEGSNDQKEWFSIQTGRIIAINKTPVNYQYNQVYFPNTQYNFLRFGVKNSTALALRHVDFYQTKTTKGLFSEIGSTYPFKQLINKVSCLYNLISLHSYLG